MASRKRSISRSVACSLAALLLLSGCMFMVSTFQSDSEEWVLVEDQVLEDYGVYCSAPSESDTGAEYTFTFDEDTATYTYEVTGGSKLSSNKNNVYAMACADGFDFSKNYKFEFVSSSVSTTYFNYYIGTSGNVVFDLRSIQSADDGSYSGSVVILDQLVTDLSYKDCLAFNCNTGSDSGTFSANTFTMNVYELQTDNTGSIAAGISGLIMIVCGVFAMPMHNILRRR